MSLTKDEIALIKKEAQRLEHLTDDIDFSYSPTKIRLPPSILTDELILLLLREYPGLGKRIEDRYKVLDDFFEVCQSFLGYPFEF